MWENQNMVVEDYMSELEVFIVKVMKNVVFWMLPGNFEGTYQHEDKARSFL
jgi:hypothetical protein